MHRILLMNSRGLKLQQEFINHKGEYTNHAIVLPGGKICQLEQLVESKVASIKQESTGIRDEDICIILAAGICDLTSKKKIECYCYPKCKQTTYPESKFQTCKNALDNFNDRFKHMTLQIASIPPMNLQDYNNYRLKVKQLCALQISDDELEEQQRCLS